MRLDDEELELLAGHGASRLSHAAKVAYLLGIRPYMDFATGLVGYRRRVSYQSLAELLEFSPGRGSHRPQQRFSREALRAVFRELERAGLIRWIKNEDSCLFFECLAATRDISPEMRNNPRTTPSSHPMNNPPKPNNDAGFNGVGQPHEQPPLHGDEQPTSGYPVNTNTHLTRGRAREPVDNSANGMPACIPEAEWRLYEQERNLATGKPMSIGRRLALWQELAALDAEGYDLGKVLRRCVAHGFATFDRRPELMKKPIEATYPLPGTHPAATKRGHHAAIRDVDNSAVARTRRACERWESQFDARSGDAESDRIFEGEFDPPTLQ